VQWNEYSVISRWYDPHTLQMYARAPVCLMF
jgi:hypothetical protein